MSAPHVRPFSPILHPLPQVKNSDATHVMHTIHVDAISIQLKMVRLAVYFVVQYAMIPRHKQSTERGLLLRKIVNILMYKLQIS